MKLFFLLGLLVAYSGVARAAFQIPLLRLDHQAAQSAGSGRIVCDIYPDRVERTRSINDGHQLISSEVTRIRIDPRHTRAAIANAWQGTIDKKIENDSGGYELYSGFYVRHNRVDHVLLRSISAGTHYTNTSAAARALLAFLDLHCR